MVSSHWTIKDLHVTIIGRWLIIWSITPSIPPLSAMRSWIIILKHYWTYRAGVIVCSLFPLILDLSEQMESGSNWTISNLFRFYFQRWTVIQSKTIILLPFMVRTQQKTYLKKQQRHEALSGLPDFSSLTPYRILLVNRHADTLVLHGIIRAAKNYRYFSIDTE